MSEFQSRCDAAAWFLSVLFEGYESGYVEMRAFRKEGGNVVKRRDYRALPLKSLNGFAAELVRLSDASFDVYVGVLPREEKRGVAESVRHARWIWADFDGKNMQMGQLDAVAQGADMAVDSGHGVHCYWQIPPRVLDSQKSRKAFCIAMRSVQKKQSDDAADDVSDLPRILRVPGTWNWKNGEKVPVRLVKAPAAVEIPADDIAPMGDAEHARIKLGVKEMIAAARQNALPMLSPAWRSCRKHIVNDPNVWVRGQLTWWVCMLRGQESNQSEEETESALRSRAVIDSCVEELTSDFVNLFLRLDSEGYDPTGWENNPLFTLEEVRGY